MTLEYSVRFLPHDRLVHCPETQAVLDAAQGAGLGLPHSCRSGHCGSCRARLLSGEIHYPNGPPLGLSAQEKAEGYVLLCQARPRTDLTVAISLVTAAAQAEIKSLPCRVVKLTLLGPDVMQVSLRLPAVEPLEFRAGQYVDVLLEEGRRRSFSIASPPGQVQEIELHVRRVAGGLFSERLFRTMATGALLRIEGPLGRFLYDEAPDGPPVIFIAGGTGFAPIKSMLAQALEQGGSQPLYLYWGARTIADVYQEALMRELAREHPRLSFHPVLSHAGDVAPPYRAGWVHEAVLADFPHLAGLPVYAAGPPQMILAIRDAFEARGARAAQLHFDVFDYAVDPPRRQS